MDLKLVLKKQWYLMIEALIKKEEYRDFSLYWLHRLVDKSFYDQVNSCIVGGRHVPFKKFDTVTFYLGYAKNRPQMTFKCLGIEKGEGREEWGAEKGKCYFIIKLGERI